MLDKLIIKSNNEFERLRVYGIQHSGLSMTIFVADRPTRYVTRIKKVVKLSVSSDETMFKDSVLPLLVTTWMLRQNILKVKQIVANNRNKKRDKRDSSWLQTSWKEQEVMIMPATSTSTEYIKASSAKKKKADDDKKKE